MPRGKRKRLARGIFADAAGIAITIPTGKRGRQIERRHPHGTPLKTLKTIRARLILEHQADTAKATRGTFEADATRYLDLVRHLAGWTERRSEIRAWVARLGSRSRTSITRGDVQSARAAWLDDDKSPKTINNRVAALRAMYHELDGDDTETPADGIRPLTVAAKPIVSVTSSRIAAVYQKLEAAEKRGHLRDRKTRARFRMLAETGRRPSELMRAKPDDFDLERRIWHVRDGKGGFTPGGLYLTDSMMIAAREFIAADAFGSYNTGSFAIRLRNAGWPASVRPYNLRHSVGIAMADSGADHMDIAHALGHRDPRTTKRNYVGIRESRTRAALERIDGRIPFDQKKAG